MRALVFDTETTGLPIEFHAPFDCLKNWPAVTQLGVAVVDLQTGRTTEQMSMVLKLPRGEQISSKASEITGWTTEDVNRIGYNPVTVWRTFRGMLTTMRRSGDVVAVAHNAAFDVPVIVSNMCRFAQQPQWSEDPVELFDIPVMCTKLIGVDVCKIPSPRVSGSYKWPSLQELHTHLFGKGFDGAHDALADVQATARCFVELFRRKLVPTGPVNFFNPYSQESQTSALTDV